ncbi:hypothetical protein QTP86_025573, partial [Hemibagrus guttatus]
IFVRVQKDFYEAETVGKQFQKQSAPWSTETKVALSLSRWKNGRNVTGWERKKNHLRRLLDVRRDEKQSDAALFNPGLTRKEVDDLVGFSGEISLTAWGNSLLKKARQLSRTFRLAPAGRKPILFIIMMTRTVPKKRTIVPGGAEEL